MYRLIEEQTALVEKARQIGDDVIAPHAAEVDRESRFPDEAMQALGEAGLLGLTVPAEYGGLGRACARLRRFSTRSRSATPRSA